MVNTKGTGGSARKYDVDKEMAILRMQNGMFYCKECPSHYSLRKNARAHVRNHIERNFYVRIAEGYPSTGTGRLRA